MNPLTQTKNIQKLSQRELELGIEKKSWHDVYKGSAWVFIGGLPYDLTEGDVICLFSQYGEPVNLNMVRDKVSGKSKGFCFLCYEDQRSTVLAVDNLNGTKILGRTIRVDHVADYKPPKDPDKLEDEAKMLLVEGCGPGTKAAAATGSLYEPKGSKRKHDKDSRHDEKQSESEGERKDKSKVKHKKKKASDKDSDSVSEKKKEKKKKKKAKKSSRDSESEGERPTHSNFKEKTNPDSVKEERKELRRVDLPNDDSKKRLTYHDQSNKPRDSSYDREKSQKHYRNRDSEERSFERQSCRNSGRDRNRSGLDSQQRKDDIQPVRKTDDPKPWKEYGYERDDRREDRRDWDSRRVRERSRSSKEDERHDRGRERVKDVRKSERERDRSADREKYDRTSGRDRDESDRYSHREKNDGKYEKESDRSGDHEKHDRKIDRDRNRDDRDSQRERDDRQSSKYRDSSERDRIHKQDRHRSDKDCGGSREGRDERNYRDARDDDYKSSRNGKIN